MISNRPGSSEESNRPSQVDAETDRLLRGAFDRLRDDASAVDTMAAWHRLDGPRRPQWLVAGVLGGLTAAIFVIVALVVVSGDDDPGDQSVVTAADSSADPRDWVDAETDRIRESEQAVDVEPGGPAERPRPDAPLVGTTWVLDTLTDGDETTSVSGSDRTLVFFANGGFRADVGCNELGASPDESGEMLSFMTLVRCPSGDDEADGATKAVLGDGEFTTSINGHRLIVTATGEGALGLSLGYYSMSSERD